MTDSKSINLKINLSWIIVFLLLTNLLTIFIWKPWENTSSGTANRTIKTSGQSTISTEPDQYTFSPSYEFTGDSNDAVNDLVAKKSNEVVEGLKGIGVDDAKIKVDANSYDNYYFDEELGKTRGYLTISVVADSREFAQSISDYLADTSSQGNITPNAQFSTEKQKTLEADARSAAIADARKNAERTASDLDAELGEVQSVTDGSNISYPWFGYDVRAEAATLDSATVESVTIQPGENEFTF